MFRTNAGACPRCNVPLIPNGRLQYCNLCGGVMANFSDDAADEAALPLTAIARALVEIPGVAQNCPACGAPTAVSAIFDIVVHACAQHGIWFDRDRLTQLQKRLATCSLPPAIRCVPVS